MTGAGLRATTGAAEKTLRRFRRRSRRHVREHAAGRRILERVRHRRRGRRQGPRELHARRRQFLHGPRHSRRERAGRSRRPTRCTRRRSRWSTKRLPPSYWPARDPIGRRVWIDRGARRARAEDRNHRRDARHQVPETFNEDSQPLVLRAHDAGRCVRPTGAIRREAARSGRGTDAVDRARRGRDQSGDRRSNAASLARRSATVSCASG